MIRDIDIVNSGGTTAANCLRAASYTLPLVRQARHEATWTGLAMLHKSCASVTPTMSVIQFFSPEHDFRSSIALDFPVPIFATSAKPDSPEYREKEAEAQRIIREHLTLSPTAHIETDHIGIYDKKIILSVTLDPTTRYTMQYHDTVWDFMTPENKSLILRMRDPVTLSPTSIPPVIELLSYHAPAKARPVSVCPISLEDFAKIEIFLKNADIS